MSEQPTTEDLAELAPAALAERIVAHTVVLSRRADFISAPELRQGLQEIAQMARLVGDKVIVPPAGRYEVAPDPTYLRGLHGAATSPPLYVVREAGEPFAREMALCRRREDAEAYAAFLNSQPAREG